MKELTTSFTAAAVLAAALAILPSSSVQAAAAPQPAKPQGTTAKADPFAGGATELEFSLEACTADDFTLAAVYVYEASTGDLAQIGQGNIEAGANKLLEDGPLQELADEWDAFAKTVATPMRGDAIIKTEQELAEKTLSFFMDHVGAVHTRNPRGVVTVLDDDGPGCAARLALRP